VKRRCGWTVRFGPVYAADLPRYLERGGKKADDMRSVRFGVAERLQMAASWGVPSALLLSLGSLPFRPAWSLPLAALAAGLALAVFLVYDRIPGPRRALVAAGTALLSALAVWLCGGGGAALVAGPLASLGLTGLLTFDYAGSTPVEAGSHFESRRWRIALDLDRCVGVYSCWEVCPEACFEKRPDARKVDLAHDERCVQCGACVVQCPEDALYFRDDAGRRIEPQVIRRYKLNLMGRRAVDTGA
jgi:NAD-dependent dihydropyrimidine dehydrogenase PreA subunit